MTDDELMDAIDAEGCLYCGDEKDPDHTLCMACQAADAGVDAEET